jgi:small subunit ribosomal protein S12
MPTFIQIIKNLRKKKIHKKKTPALEKNPQKKGICIKVYTTTPKKPNSAIRKVTKVKLSNKRNVISFIPGGAHTLQKFSVVLIRGGRVRDLPGVKYKCIRGKYALHYLMNRKNKRSKYGTPKPK